jgi:hypothetical protein
MYQVPAEKDARMGWKKDWDEEKALATDYTDKHGIYSIDFKE